MFPFADFPFLAAAIQDGIQRQLHTGIQVYISQNCRPLLNSAMGEATPGRSMTPSAIMPWRSAGKPLTALLILKFIEKNHFGGETTLQDLLPETAVSDKAAVTIFELLTHQSGFPSTETGWPEADWRTTIARIIAEPRQLPIGTAAYHPQSSWFLLGEILRRSGIDESTVSFETLLQKELLTPAGLTRTHCGIPAEFIVDQTDELPVLYERDKGQLIESAYGSDPWLTRPSPGGNIRGPISELGRFYELMLRNGESSGGLRIVSETTVRQMCARHRAGQYDQTLQHVIDFGLGIILNSNRHGPETVPYGFGRFASDDAFGHGGSQCSMGFCDPQHNLVVAWTSNGFCGEGQHQRRNRMINDAVYKDLGLA